MARHHHLSCSQKVSEPPMNLWNTTNVVAFRKSEKESDAIEQCCGLTTNIVTYKKDCFQFCSTQDNTTEVKSCIEDHGVDAKSYHNDKGGQSAANPMSKPAASLILLVVTSLIVGTF
ncbi:hypothetical protein NUU61_008759 [Penicillium alfredii]|uniref:Uncharacterized protein n=1 Tax=Penicillium alfredii TaxID=1506179 RepID=A0A9W9JWL7_9EURO|nr:uncharacterized protein NUU61_008759 [Penicillium alfredii]KAJ5084180.1 hypothetical protein NUU61_008759 [Penicillium alfredii]